MRACNANRVGCVSASPAPAVLPRESHGVEVGRVTSATYSPTLAAALALAMIRREANAVGTALDSSVGSCEVISLPLKSVSS